MANEIRRYLIAVGIATYEAGEWGELEHVPKELESIVNLLTQSPFQLVRMLEPESRSPSKTFLTALSAWAKGTERQVGDHVVLYWSGHGAVVQGRLHLILP